MPSSAPTPSLIRIPHLRSYAILTKNSLARAMLSGVLLSMATMLMTGCQTTKVATSPPSTNIVGERTVGDNPLQRPSRLQRFNIRGKIGITTPATDTQQGQAGSAFYAWAQEEDRFAIDLAGAMGLGHTVIEYNGSTATLVSERTGEISADSPDELLSKATGWSAPISQFSYWISGRPAPSDDNNVVDALGRIQTAFNGDWTASFDYSHNTATDDLPNKIKVIRTDGYKVIITISHIRP